MQNEMKQFLQYMKVFQVCDSTFPIGTFNHSFGLENYLTDGRIRKAPEFEKWLNNYYRSQFKYGEGLLVKLCYAALDAQEPARLWHYDRVINVSTLAIETRTGARLIAKQMLNLLRLLDGELAHLDEYEQRIADGRCFGNPAIIFALYAHAQQIPVENAFVMYGYSIGSTLVQNAVRAIPLGQKDGQLILHRTIGLLAELCQMVMQLDDAYLGANSPGLELAQIKHETQLARLFMS